MCSNLQNKHSIIRGRGHDDKALGQGLDKAEKFIPEHQKKSWTGAGGVGCPKVFTRSQRPIEKITVKNYFKCLHDRSSGNQKPRTASFLFPNFSQDSRGNGILSMKGAGGGRKRDEVNRILALSLSPDGVKWNSFKVNVSVLHTTKTHLIW